MFSSFSNFYDISISTFNFIHEPDVYYGALLWLKYNRCDEVWGYWASGTWCCVVGWVLPDVSSRIQNCSSNNTESLPDSPESPLYCWEILKSLMSALIWIFPMFTFVWTHWVACRC